MKQLSLDCGAPFVLLLHLKNRPLQIPFLAASALEYSCVFRQYMQQEMCPPTHAVSEGL